MTSFFFLSFPNLQMCLWSCQSDFFFSPFPQQLKLQTGAARVFSSSSSSSSPFLSVFLLLHSLLSSKTHRRTKHHQPAPTVSAGPQMCTKTTRASEKRMEICCYISALFSEEESERERERKGMRERERGRSVGLQLLLPPPDSSLRIAPFFTHCLLF